MFINYTPLFYGILHFDGYANKALLNKLHCVRVCEKERMKKRWRLCVCVNNNISLMNEYIEFNKVKRLILSHTHTHTSPLLCHLKHSCPPQTQTVHHAVAKVTAPLCIPLPGTQLLWQWWRILTVGFWYKSSLLFSFLVFLPSSLSVCLPSAVKRGIATCEKLDTANNESDGQMSCLFSFPHSLHLPQPLMNVSILSLIFVSRLGHKVLSVIISGVGKKKTLEF